MSSREPVLRIKRIKRTKRVTRSTADVPNLSPAVRARVPAARAMVVRAQVRKMRQGRD